MPRKPGRFCRDLNLLPKKTSNHPATKAAKTAVREAVMGEIGAGNSHVFDAFAGDGQMWRSVWHKAASYIGCDLDWYRDERVAFVHDNRRVLRSIDLSRFSIFDFDAFGSPWDQVTILAARRPIGPGEKLGLVLTEGSGIRAKLGVLPLSLSKLAGINPHAAGLARDPQEVIQRALGNLCANWNCTVNRHWLAKGKTGAGILYIGIVLQGNQ
jgi:hypothetical protein